LNRAIAILFLLSATLLSVGAGPSTTPSSKYQGKFADSEERAAFIRAFKNNAGMNSPPQEIEPKRMGVGERVEAGDLAFELPPGWHSPGPAEWKNGRAAIKATTPDGSEVVIQYWPQDRFDQHLHRELLYNLGFWVDNPRERIESLRSDLAFYAHVFDITVDQIDGTDTDDQRWTYAVLRHIKMRWLPTFTMRLDGPRATAFAGRRRAGPEERSWVRVELFDPQERLRAFVLISFEPGFGNDELDVEVLKHFVASAEFTGPPPTTNAATRPSERR